MLRQECGSQFDVYIMVQCSMLRDLSSTTLRTSSLFILRYAPAWLYQGYSAGRGGGHSGQLAAGKRANKYEEKTIHDEKIEIENREFGKFVTI